MLWDIRKITRISLEEVGWKARRRDIVFFGEIHERPGILEAELDLLEKLYSECNCMSVFMEMFNYKQQELLESYLESRISWAELREEYSKSREGFNIDLYKPLIDTASRLGLRVYGIMPPREYAAEVARRGLGVLQELGEEIIDPRDVAVDLPGYRERFYKMIPREGPMAKLDPHRLLEAQAYKDSVAARIISETIASKKCSCRPLALVVMGYGHIEHAGTVPSRIDPGYSYLVITSRIVLSKIETKRVAEALSRDHLLIASYAVIAYEEA